MRFSIAASVAALSALASAGVTNSEDATVSDLSIRDNNGIQSASFTLQGVKCSVSSGADIAGGKLVKCGTSPYQFGLSGSHFDYTLTVTRDKDTAAAISGSAKAAVYCHAGGNGPNDFVCSQVDKITVNLKQT